MLLGTEDFSDVPVDFADMKKVFGDKDLTVDGFSFPADVSVETFIRQTIGYLNILKIIIFLHLLKML